MKLPKNVKVDVSHQFKSEKAKGEVYVILVIDFTKWTNILRHPKRKKWTNKLGRKEYISFQEQVYCTTTRVKCHSKLENNYFRKSWHISKGIILADEPQTPHSPSQWSEEIQNMQEKLWIYITFHVLRLVTNQPTNISLKIGHFHNPFSPFKFGNLFQES